MNSFLLFGLVAFSVPLASQGEIAAGAPMRDAATHEELAARAASAKDPTATMTQVVLAADPSVVNKPGDLLSRSDILCFGEYATLVPKLAILHRPKNLESRIGFQTGAKIQVFSEFLAANRGWISTVEVSRAQAEGNAPLPVDTEKSISKSPYIIVATYQGGPISMLPKKSPPAPAEAPTRKP